MWVGDGRVLRPGRGLGLGGLRPGGGSGDPNDPGYENPEQPADDGGSDGGTPPPPTTVYSLAYTYDVLGNRLTKTDHVNGRTTTYHYDVNEPSTAFASNNNRLMLRSAYAGVGGSASVVCGPALSTPRLGSGRAPLRVAANRNSRRCPLGTPRSA